MEDDVCVLKMLTEDSDEIYGEHWSMHYQIWSSRLKAQSFPKFY